MNLFTRKSALIAFTILFTQLFFSCSSTNLHSYKINYQYSELAISQVNILNINHAGEAILSAKVEDAESEKAVVLASAEAKSSFIGERKLQPVKSLRIAENPHAEEKVSHSTIKHNKVVKELKSPKQEKSNGKNQWIALGLALLLGAYGVHRFYLGHKGTAFTQLALIILALLAFIAAILLISLEIPALFLSLYALGFVLVIINSVWVIFDIVNILIGNLKPKDGEYSETIDF